ncbi:MAG: hypothetical protein ACPGEC_02220 [Flavobacteriales bacterium]
MKKIALCLLALSLGLASCDSTPEFKTLTPTVDFEHYFTFGEAFQNDTVFSMESFQDLLNYTDQKHFTLEGEILSETSGKPGRWISLKNPKGEELFILCDHVQALPKFIRGRRAIVSGKYDATEKHIIAESVHIQR